MCKTILDHPHRTEIDAVICSGGTLREIRETLKRSFAVDLSQKTICKYRQDYLPDFEPNSQPEPEPIEPFELDFETIQTLTTELQNGKIGIGTVLHREYAELVAVQIQLTKNALIQHAKGLARYPSEYVRNLSILTGIMNKNQQTNPTPNSSTDTE